ncbi:TIR domain-containing protein [Portibacter marinus]|uniref:TIR domain-containing protein n=1 Tax=Portibacter marinus TaxID=2898660 RepID=UPI001F432C99|nr:TIR domain-containing protein [Portibacter marinus]
MKKVKHKCFISFHRRDKDEVDEFCQKFSGSFIRRGLLMEDDIVDSKNTDYVMRRIREQYLKDSTVTIVLVGKCTWARRFVDWEVQASLRNPSASYPNGLVAIQLRNSYKKLPSRVKLNIDSSYAKFYEYPTTNQSLSNIIDEAYYSRYNYQELIVNPRERNLYNRTCEY